jgi:hypothetical protein
LVVAVGTIAITLLFFLVVVVNGFFRTDADGSLSGRILRRSGIVES